MIKIKREDFINYLRLNASSFTLLEEDEVAVSIQLPQIIEIEEISNTNKE